MKVLFVGGTGLISTACTELAVGRGIDLYLLNRGKRQEQPPAGARLLHADIRDEQQARNALEGHTWDAVVDFIAFTPQHVETDLRLFAGKTAHYIFISSASVYQKPLTHWLITESTPLANPYWEYSRNKIACEERVIGEYRRNGFPGTIVRPSLTYGPSLIPMAYGPWSAPWTLADRILRRKPVIVHGDGSSLWVTTHNSDFAKGFVPLLGNVQAVGHAFHITSDEVLSWDQHCQIIGRTLGVEPKIVHVPTDVLCAMDPSQEGGLKGDKTWSVVFDNTKIKRFSPGYVATTPLIEGVRQSVQWYKAHPSRQRIDEAFNAMTDRIIGSMPAAAG